jgi:hypothetical protein
VNRVQVHAEQHDHIGRCDPGQPVDHVAGDAAGKIPAGVGNDAAHRPIHRNGLVFSFLEKLVDLVLAGLSVRWIPASGKDGFSQVHGRVLPS